MNRLGVTLLLLLGLFLAGLASADERILNYDSNVIIHRDGALTVTETIRVRSEGREIRRGIYRDFPTDYTDRFGNRYRVEFQVEAVQRDGTAEDWHTEKRPNGTRVYIGNANRMLDPGEHEYQIRFHTNRQLGFFADHDELWWNVTGNGWAFPIDHASARVALPGEVSASDLNLSAYVGQFGSTETNAHHRIVDGRTVTFETGRPLGAYEGLSVVVEWPKGLVTEPSRVQKIRWFLRDNGSAVVLLMGLLLPFAWYFWAWSKVGRDPEKGVIIPRFKPPTGLSPAGSRYVLDMSFDRHAFIAAIISLAVKGHIKIEEKTKSFILKSREYTLRRTSPEHATALTKGEEEVLKALLPHNPSSLSMTDANHEKFQKAQNLLKTALKKEHLGRLFHLNSLYLAPPIVMSLLAAVIAIAFRGGPVVWISWGLLTVVMHGLFIWLLRAPTLSGRQVMDEIEGFKMYLGTAEQDRLDRMSSPELTPEVFETFLPYAYALGVENRWCDRFARELPQQTQTSAGYQPGWYSGRFQGTHALNHLGGSFSRSFSSAISSASSPPGSSSGGGGGGSSGGGGGGGGGGGW